MIYKTSLLFFIPILSLTLACSASEVVAQCNGGSGSGRGGGRLQTGSTGTINAAQVLNRFASDNSLATSMMIQRNQPQVIQNQAMSLAYRNAIQQRKMRSAYEDRVYPTRLARAEAIRQARANRVAARIAQRDRMREDPNGQYKLASTRK